MNIFTTTTIMYFKINRICHLENNFENVHFYVFSFLFFLKGFSSTLPSPVCCNSMLTAVAKVC